MTDFFIVSKAIISAHIDAPDSATLRHWLQGFDSVRFHARPIRAMDEECAIPLERVLLTEVSLADNVSVEEADPADPDMATDRGLAALCCAHPSDPQTFPAPTLAGLLHYLRTEGPEALTAFDRASDDTQFQEGNDDEHAAAAGVAEVLRHALTHLA